MTAPEGVSAASWARARTAHGVVLAVHGTGDSATEDVGARWWQVGSAFEAELRRAAAPSETPAFAYLPFRWSGLNSDAARARAARALAKACGRLDRMGKPYIVIGHSHGGNVAHFALSRCSGLFQGFGGLRSVVSLGTPFFVRRPNLLVLLVTLFALATFVNALIYLGLVTVTDFPAYFVQAAAELGRIAEGRRTDFTSSVLGAALAPFLLWFSWRLGVRRTLSALRWRFLIRGRVQDRWLAVRAVRDEVLGLLPKIGRRVAHYATPDQLASSIRRTAQAAGVGAASFYFLGGAYFAYLWTGNTPPTGVRYRGIAGLDFQILLGGGAEFGERLVSFLATHYYLFVFALLLHGMVWGAGRLLAASPFPKLLSALVNDAAHDVLRSAAYGQDFDDKLVGVGLEPPGVEARALVIDRAAFGSLDEADRTAAAEAFYEEVVGFRSDTALARDPAAVWARLNDALYHNAYPEDAETTQAVARELARLR